MRPEENTYPILSVQTTYQCNMACANCYLGDMLNNPKFPDVDVKKFENVIKKLPNKTHIRFIGAEPTLNSDLFELIKITRKYKHRPNMLTNGLKLAQENYVKGLKKSGMTWIGLSMNGGLDDEIYKRFDNGKYAKLKMRALENCIKNNLVPHINVIIDPSNIHILQPLISHIISLCKKYKRKIGPHFPIMLRVKSIGKMGNFLDSHTFTIYEMISIMKNLVGDIVPNFTIDGVKETNTCTFDFKTSMGKMYGKITDWSVDDDGLPLTNSKRRGIITDNYQIEPFFDYYGKIDETQHPRLEQPKRLPIATKRSGLDGTRKRTL